MAGSARFTAVLDANVLYPAALRDLLLSLAAAGLFHARWTHQIQHEWVRNLVKVRPELAGRLDDVVEQMNCAIPDCLVEGLDALIPGLVLPDPDDRHVLAAAIAGHADVIVTFNLKDFPAPTLAPHHLQAQHPDDFVLNQLELNPLEALAAIKKMRSRLRRPPLDAAEFTAIIARNGLPATANRLRQTMVLI